MKIYDHDKKTIKERFIAKAQKKIPYFDKFYKIISKYSTEDYIDFSIDFLLNSGSSQLIAAKNKDELVKLLIKEGLHPLRFLKYYDKKELGDSYFKNLDNNLGSFLHKYMSKRKIHVIDLLSILRLIHSGNIMEFIDESIINLFGSRDLVNMLTYSRRRNSKAYIINHLNSIKTKLETIKKGYNLDDLIKEIPKGGEFIVEEADLIANYLTNSRSNHLFNLLGEENYKLLMYHQPKQVYLIEKCDKNALLSIYELSKRIKNGLSIFSSLHDKLKVPYLFRNNTGSSRITLWNEYAIDEDKKDILEWYRLSSGVINGINSARTYLVNNRNKRRILKDAIIFPRRSNGGRMLERLILSLHDNLILSFKLPTKWGNCDLRKKGLVATEPALHEAGGIRKYDYALMSALGQKVIINNQDTLDIGTLINLEFYLDLTKFDLDKFLMSKRYYWDGFEIDALKTLEPKPKSEGIMINMHAIFSEQYIGLLLKKSYFKNWKKIKSEEFYDIESINNFNNQLNKNYLSNILLESIKTQKNKKTS